MLLQEPYYPVSEVNGENEDLSVSHVRTIMYEIMVNPGKFDDFSKILVEALTSTIKDVHSLRAVVYAIFEQVCIALKITAH